LLNLVLIGAALGLGIGVKEIETVFGIVGSTTSTLIAFILPSLFWVKMNPEPFFSCSNFYPVIVIAVGSFIGIFSLIVSIIKLIDSSIIDG